MRIVGPLRHRSFRLLFSGQVVSDVGDWLDYLALVALIVYYWDYGPGALAALAIAMAGPWLVVAPFAGVWVDRLPRRTTMVTSDLVRAALVLGLFLAPNLHVLLVLVALKFSASTFFIPARQASIQLSVPASDLLAATSVSQLSLQLSKIVGPALGGLFMAALGPRPVFLIDAATFLVSAAVLSRLPRFAPERYAETAPRFWSELRGGMSWIGRSRALVFGLASMSAAVFIVFTFDALSPLAFEQLGFGVSTLGLAIATIGGGAVAGALLIGEFGQRFDPFLLLGGGKFLAGASVAAIGVAVVADLDAPSWSVLPLLALIGLGASGILIPWGYILQRETPAELLGRVTVTATAVPTVLAVCAPPIGALTAKALGVGAVFVLGGAGLVALGVVVFLGRPDTPGGTLAAEHSDSRAQPSGDAADPPEKLAPRSASS